MHARQILSQLSCQPLGEGGHARQQRSAMQTVQHTVVHTELAVCAGGSGPSRSPGPGGACMSDGGGEQGHGLRKFSGGKRDGKRGGQWVLKSQTLAGTPGGTHGGVRAAKGASQL